MRVGPRDDHEVLVPAGVGRGLDLLDHLLRRDHLAAEHVPAPLGEDLVLELDGADAGPLVLADRAADVQRVAVAGVAVRQHRDVDGLGDVAGVLDHLVHRQEADVGLAEDAGRGAVAGHVDGVEPGHLDHLGAQYVVGARRHEQLPVREQLLQPCGFLHQGTFRLPLVVIAAGKGSAFVG